MKIASLSLFGAAVAAALFVPSEASALGPVGVEVGAKVGGGTNPSDASPNPLGFGVGGRAGVSVFGFYAGLSYMYYFGGTRDSVSAKSMLYGVEAGYGLNILGLFTIRPQLGVGVYDAKYEDLESQPPGVSTVQLTGEGKNLYLEPGLTAVVPFGFWFVGADANALFLPGLDGSRAAFTAHGQIGLKF